MADINIKFSGDGPTGGGRSGDLTRLGEVLNAFADKVEKAVSTINKSGRVDSKKAAREFRQQHLKDSMAAKKADRADRVSAQKKIYSAKSSSLKGVFSAKGTQDRKTKELEYLKKKEILMMKENLSDKQHLQRLERDKTRHEQGLKSIAANAAVAGMTAGAAAVGYAIRNIISTLGTSAATAALTNNANPAGSTLATYYGQNISAASGGIQAGTVLGASAIGSKFGLKGALIGALVGTVLSGVESALGANFSTGYQLNTQRQYLGNLLGTVYGSQFGSISQGTLKGGQLIPGTDNLSGIASSLSGRVFGKNAFTAGAYGSAIAAYYGNELGETPQIAGSIGTIAQLSGKGGSGTSISQYLQQLIALQVQYGGDMAANLKNISDLLAGSSVRSAAQAASTVYRNNLLGPGFSGAANNYLMSGPLEQFAQRTMVKGLTGVDMNDLTGLNGKSAQGAAIRKLQAYIGPTKTGGANTRAFAAEAVLGGGAAFYGFNNAQAGNLNMANHPMNRVLRQSVAGNLNTLAKGAAPSESQLKGMYDQSTQQVMGMRANSMEVEATTVKIYGTVNNSTNPLAGFQAFRSRSHGGV